MYIKVSPYPDAEGLSQVISCLHNAIINAASRIGGKIYTLGLYRQFPPRGVKDTRMTEFEKCEYLSYVTTIATVLKIDREKWVLWESSW